MVVTQAISNLVLRADDGFGHTGLSESLQVVFAPTLDSQVFGDVMLLLWPAGAPALKLEYATNLPPTSWTPVASPLQIGDQYTVPVILSDPQRFYRLRYTVP